MNAPTAFPDPSKPVPPYKHTPLFPLGKDETPYKKISSEGVRVEKVLGKDMLVVSHEALRALSEAAFGDINHYLRPGHLKQLRAILEDGEASPNDKFVALDFLKNANIAAGGVLPMCQDTGTAIIMGKKGCNVITDGADEAALSEGARDAYLRRNLRYSQVAPLSMYEEKNTANNMPAQCEIYAEGDDAYKFMFMAKGGGSANKSFLFQATPSVLTKDRLLAFLKEKILTLGTAACPPYHLAIVIGGTSAEALHEDGEARFRPLSRCAADPRLARRQRLPRRRNGKRDPQDDAVARRRRAVRRKIFLPRRARDPHAASRRLAADRAWRVVLGRSPGARQDHQGRRLSRGGSSTTRRSICRKSKRRSAARSSRSTSTSR